MDVDHHEDDQLVQAQLVDEVDGVQLVELHELLDELHELSDVVLAHVDQDVHVVEVVHC